MMQREYGFDNGNGTSASKGLRFLAYPSIEYGREKVENISVAGKKGTLTKRTGIYTDTIISNKMEYVSESRELSETERIVLTEWLKSTKTVSYSDMPDYFFKVKKVEIDDALRKYGIYGNMTAEFTCEPGIYLKSGEKAQTVVSGAKLKNSHSVCSPLYKISGEGVLTLTVNGKKVTANVGQNLTIDTELMMAYRQDGTIQNTALTGDYEDLFLQPGDNIITFSSGFTVSIVPRWRILL